MIERFYTETLTYVSPTTSTASWGTEPGWSTAATTFAGAINPISGAILLRNDKETPRADYKLFCSSTVGLAEHCRVRWGGSSFEVVFVKNTLDMGHHKMVPLKKIYL